ncbi:hypothetical protein ACF0H5_012573 [Mactra antiquata]
MKIALVVTGLVLTIIVNGTSALRCNSCSSTKDLTCQDTKIEQIYCDGVCYEMEAANNRTKFFDRGCTNEFDDARCSNLKNDQYIKMVGYACFCTEDLCNDGTLANDDDNGGKNQDDNSNGGTHHFSSITFVIGVMSTVLIVKNSFIANIL